MTDTRSNDSPSVIDRTHEVAAEGSVIAAYFLGRTAAFILSEEAIVLAAPDGEPQRIVVASNTGFMGFDLGTLMTLGQGGGFPPHMFLGGAVSHDALSNPSPTQNPTQ